MHPAEAQRPRTHCGAMHRRLADVDEKFQPNSLAYSTAGSSARELVGDCQSCAKFRLRLENAERARVRAQEQLAKLQAENLSLRGLRPKSTAERPESPSSSFPDADAASNVLEGYRREVALLHDAVCERDAQREKLLESQRKQMVEHDVARQEWEAQVARLVCEVQELEATNCELENRLREVVVVSSAVYAAPVFTKGASCSDEEALKLS